MQINISRMCSLVRAWLLRDCLQDRCLDLLVRSPMQEVSEAVPALFPRVRTCRYLGATIDPRLTYRRYVADLLARCGQTTSIARRKRGLRWRPSPPPLLGVHCAGSLFRILYVASDFPPTPFLR